MRARASGKGVLTSPLNLLELNHIGVILTFAVYDTNLPVNATDEQLVNSTVGYLGASYDVPSLVERLLQQLASKQTIAVNVYDTTNNSSPIKMYGDDENDTGLLHISYLDFGDPTRKHEMHCRFKHKAPLPWTAIIAFSGLLIIILLLGHIFHAAINRIAKVERDYWEMMQLKHRAEAADIAKSQFLATVSHEIRTPMNGVLGMLQMLMETNLDVNQLDYAQVAHSSGRDLISLTNEVLDQAKIESGKLELEAVPFDIRVDLDKVVSLLSSKLLDKEIELAVYVSNQVPEILIGDPGRFRQIITNLVGNSIKFTKDKGHIFVTVHLAEEAKNPIDIKDEVLKQTLNSIRDSNSSFNTLSGFPVVNRWKSWENFKNLNRSTQEQNQKIQLLITIEDTGEGIPNEARERIFTPFVQADSSTSRKYGGTGIGLSISKRLVDLMDGEIGLASESGIGSTFSFTATFSKGEKGNNWQQFDFSVSEFRGLKALVIDEKKVHAEVTKYHLQRLGIFALVSSMDSAPFFLSPDANLSVTERIAFVFIEKESWKREECSRTLLGVLKDLRSNGLTSNMGIIPKTFLLATLKSLSEENNLKVGGLMDHFLTKPLRFSVLISCLQEATGFRRQKRVFSSSETSIERNGLRGKNILIVDDNRVNRFFAEVALRKYGAIVTSEASGMGAVERLKPPHVFNACFMDLQMPEMDGFKATRKIRLLETEYNEKNTSDEISTAVATDIPRNWHTPIIAMTADVIQATDEKCRKCGMDGYISKPFNPEQLYSALVRFFESSAPVL